MKRFLSILLCVAVLLAPLSVVGSAVQRANRVTIFVDGLNTCDVYSTVDNSQILPPSGETIGNEVKNCIVPILASLVTGNYHIMEEPLMTAVENIFGKMLCDENGRAINAASAYQIPTEQEIRAKLNSRDLSRSTDRNYIRFTYNWCESIQNIAADLRVLIERTVRVSGCDTVSLVGFSMGTCVVASYLKMYDYEYVDSVVFLAGAYDGVGCCGEPFARKLGFNGDATVRFLECILGEDETSQLIKNLLRTLNKQGILDVVIKRVVNPLVNQLGDRVYEDALPRLFARIPGLWSLCPLEYYDEARQFLTQSGLYEDGYIKMIDWYHYEVQAHMEQLLQGCLDRGIHLGIIAKYGFAGVPVVEKYNAMGDTVIETAYESFGATCADVNTDLGANYVQKIENGHNCISPDNMIDASSAKFCGCTWFVKNLTHSHLPDCVFEIADYVINSEEQVSVWDGKIDQFLLYRDGTIAPLTEQNDYTVYTADFSKLSAFSAFSQMTKSLWALLKK